jgi:hypothetical protein
MAGAGLEYDTGLVPMGLHAYENRWLGVVQVDQDVARVSIRVIGLDVYVATFAVANAQKSEGRQMQQLGRSPQPFAGERPLGNGVDQTDQIQFVGHGRQLAADSVPGESESTVEHAGTSHTRFPSF